MFEIGNSLREARTRKGLDFPELETGTKIRAKYLRALEDEEFETLPSATYVKGFLRTYADYLGLDGQLYVDEYNVALRLGRRGARAAGTQQRLAPRGRTAQRRRRLESKLVWLTLVAHRRRDGARDRRLAVRRQRPPDTCRSTRRPRRRGARSRRRACSSARSAATRCSLVRSGSESGRQVWNGTLTNGSMQRFARGKRPVGLHRLARERAHAAERRAAVLVGGAKPRSLIVTSGDIALPGPGT